MRNLTYFSFGLLALGAALWLKTRSDLGPGVHRSQNGDREHAITAADGVAPSGVNLAADSADQVPSARSIATFPGGRTEASSSLSEVTAPATRSNELDVTFMVNGAKCEMVRYGLVTGGDPQVRSVGSAEWSAALRTSSEAIGVLATDRTWGTPVRWSGPIDGAVLEALGNRIEALPVLSVRGIVVTVETLEPIAEATVEIEQAIHSHPFAPWLFEDSATQGATTGLDGRFEIQLTVGGASTITAKSPLHRSASIDRTINEDADLGECLALVPRETLRVTLIGGEREPERHFAAHHLYGTRARFSDGWTADVPLDPELQRLEIAVGLPGATGIETEITTFFPGEPKDYPEGVTIVLNGAALDLVITGTPPDEQPLVALAHFHSPEGVEAFASRWVRPGDIARIPLSAPGPVMVDIAWKAPDNTPQTLVQRTVEASAGKVTPVALTLPKVVRRIHLTHSNGQAVTKGDVGFLTRTEHRFSQPGGSLDREGSYVIPDLGLADMWLHGLATDEEILFGGVPFGLDEAAGEKVQVDLGSIVSTSLGVRSVTANYKCADIGVVICDAETGHDLTRYLTNEEGVLEVRWFSASRLVALMPSGITWSPRAPIPLTPGTHDIPITLRGWLALECGAREVTALEHLESGLTLDALLADATVRREAYDKGVRFWGIPAGTYRVTLEGDSGPRPPLDVPPVVWTKVAALDLR